MTPPSPPTAEAKGTATRTMLNKVPEATIYFWVIKILATTVGETVSDYFNTTLNRGLVGTFVIMA